MFRDGHGNILNVKVYLPMAMVAIRSDRLSKCLSILKRAHEGLLGLTLFRCKDKAKDMFGLFDDDMKMFGG